MATIRPFRGLRFGSELGPIDKLTAPPYDVLSQEQRDAYAARSPFNVVHLTLPEQKEDDRSKYIKYGRSAERLADWRRTGNLQLEDEPAIYRYVQRFRISQTGPELTRTSLIALLKTEPYEKGVVLPHEQTFPKHKEDRLRILEATRAHLECILGLYPDDDQSALNALISAKAAHRVETTSDDGVAQILEPITDPDAIEDLVKAFAGKQVWIADGHHRYETAVTFRQAMGEQQGLISADFMMMAFCSMSDPGLVLLPTHRILTSPLPSGSIREKLATCFTLHDCPNAEIGPRLEVYFQTQERAIGIALPGGQGLIAVQPKTQMASLDSGSDSLRLLDVSVLHRDVLEGLLDVRTLDPIRYTREASEAVQSVESGASAAFLMNPPTVEDMRVIALGGERMPQKSTYYYPKVLSGLVMWSLNDY